MSIKIKHVITGAVLLECNAKTLKLALRAGIKSGVNFRYSDLRNSDLRNSNFRNSDFRYSDFRYSNLHGVNFRNSDIRNSDFCYSNLSYSDFRNSNLHGVNFCYSDLRNSDLRNSNFRNSKNYSENHDIFQEIVRSQKAEIFTSREWECIAYICIHRICWDSIQKRFSAAAGRVFRKLADAGFGEFLERYNETKETSK